MDILTILQNYLNTNTANIVLKYIDPAFYYASKEYYHRCLDYITQHQETILTKFEYADNDLIQKSYSLQDKDTSFEFIVEKAHRLYNSDKLSYKRYPGCHGIEGTLRCKFCHHNNIHWDVCCNCYWCPIDRTCFCGCQKFYITFNHVNWITDTNLDATYCVGLHIALY
jgi:hypothetical protein